jgi:DNA mismatch endonuclease, patch repair protein
MGLRFRKDHPVRPDAGRPIRVDVAFTRHRLAVFVDGCFWHGCLEHQHLPKSNTDYWLPKLARNVERDRETDRRLHEAGWAVLRHWEHVPAAEAARRTARHLADLRASMRSPRTPDH